MEENQPQSENVWQGSGQVYDVIILGDTNHDSAINLELTKRDLQSLAKEGFTEFLFEADPARVGDINAETDQTLMHDRLHTTYHPEAAASLLMNAKDAGYTLHAIDDDTIVKTFDENYPDQEAVSCFRDYRSSSNTETFLESLSPEQEQRFFAFVEARDAFVVDARNQAMAENIINAIENGKKGVAFIGAAHSDGVEKILQERGYNVLHTRVVDPDGPLRSVSTQPEVIQNAATGEAYPPQCPPEFQRCLDQARAIISGQNYNFEQVPYEELMDARPSNAVDPSAAAPSSPSH